MLRYHPERFKITRPHAKHMVSYFKSNISDGLVTDRHFPELQMIFQRKGLSEVKRLPINRRPQNMKPLMKDLSLALHYSIFNVLGKNIFHFDADLVEKFKQTDIDEVPVSALSFPHKAFYLSFGKQEELNLWVEGYYVDGAYVSKLPGLPMQILLSTVRDDIDYKDETNWITNPDRYYYMSIDMEDPDAILSKVVDAALEEDISSTRDLANQIPVISDHELMNKDVTIIDNRKRSSELEIKEKVAGFDVFKEALRLVINGLFYITAYNEEIEERWTDETPQRLIDNLNAASTKSAQQKARAEILSQGYTKVSYCRRRYSQANPSYTGGSGEKAPHWRRGHWRNQRIGEGRRESKLVWIMPMLIRSDKGIPEEGHVYKIEG